MADAFPRCCLWTCTAKCKEPIHLHSSPGLEEGRGWKCSLFLFYWRDLVSIHKRPGSVSIILHIWHQSVLGETWAARQSPHIRYCSLTGLSGSSEQKHYKDDLFLMYFKGLSLTMSDNDHYFLQWVQGTVTESPPFFLLSRSLSISYHLQQRFIEIHDVKTWVESFKVFLMSFWDYSYGRSDQHQETEFTPSFHSCLLVEYNQKPWGSPVSTSLDL